MSEEHENEIELRKLRLAEHKNEIELRKLRLAEQKLEIERGKLAVEFAKYGFSGTLTAGIGGMILILALAIIDAVSDDFTFGANGVIWTTVAIGIGCIAFGSFSLSQPIGILAKLGKMEINVQSKT